MTIGEVIETLMSIRNDCEVMSREDYALVAACNILEKLPIGADVNDIKRQMSKIEF